MEELSDEKIQLGGAGTEMLLFTDHHAVGIAES